MFHQLRQWLVIALTIVPGIAARAADLQITIEPVFNGEPLLLDSLRCENGAGETMSVTRLSYLLSGFALERADGEWLEFPDSIAWIDAATKRTTLTIPNAPAGPFRAIRFHVGPDVVANAADVSKIPAGHPLNPNVNGLHWSWQGGYIFLAVEGLYRGDDSRPVGYAHHLARDSSRTCIHLGVALDLNHNSGVRIQFDVAKLLNATRPLSFIRDGSTTHSRDGDPIAAAIVANLPSAFDVVKVLRGTPVEIKPPPVVPIDLPEKFTPYRFTMSRTFPMPDLPRDNPLIVERVSLGKRLFHEKALSRDGTISCATCHQADAAFTDRIPLSIGIERRRGGRNSMPLFNLAWKHEFFWDGRAKSLREQVLIPIEDHREMDESLENVCRKLERSPEFHGLFQTAFRSPGITPEKIALALEQYLFSILARDSKFDRAFSGQVELTDTEKRGFELFMTEYEPRTGQFGADCFHCHGGALFTDHQFHNNGLDGDDPGRRRVTGQLGDDRKFSTPSLRNVALTAPYMHDGRFATLEEVVEHYSSGIHRSATLDPNLAKHPEKGLLLRAEDKAALVAFLKTLSDI